VVPTLPVHSRANRIDPHVPRRSRKATDTLIALRFGTTVTAHGYLGVNAVGYVHIIGPAEARNAAPMPAHVRDDIRAERQGALHIVAA